MTTRDLLAGTGEKLPSSTYRSFVIFNAGSWAATLIHAFLVPFFWYLGVKPLALFNIFSVGIYIIAMLLNRSGRHLSTVVLATVELLVHQSLCVYFIGWKAGFQFYIMTATALVFFLPAGRGAVKLLLLASTPITFITLLDYARNTPPIYALDPNLLDRIGCANIYVVFGLLGFFAYNYSRAAEIAERGMELERRKADDLLRNILPGQVITRLKAGEKLIADGIPDASVCFVDLVGFTSLSQDHSPEDVVTLLDRVFSLLDDLVTRHGLEKIKTIGDAYMVVSGAPSRRGDHAVAMARFALEARDKLTALPGLDGSPLKVRIGIASGPMVAGVIGKKKFSYDLWGDSVNTAARMESHGLPGEIQVSAPVRKKLGSAFLLEPRGTIQVKGKGPMETFLLRGATT